MAEWSWRLRVFVALVLAVPAALLAARLVSGEVTGYGWGWQMFSA